MSNGKVEDVQNGMQKYLNHKYGIEFEFVKKPYLTGNEGDGYKYQAKAIPVGKPEYEFFVEGDRQNSGTYIDGYLQTKWTYQGKQEVEKKIKETYGSNADFNLRYTFRYNDDEFKELSYQEVIAKCKGSAYVNISFDMFNESEINKEDEADKAFMIIKSYLLDNSIHKYDFTVAYFNKNFKNEYVANGNYEGKKSFEELFKEKKLINFLKVYSLPEVHQIDVKSSKDLLKFFQF